MEVMRQMNMPTTGRASRIWLMRRQRMVKSTRATRSSPSPTDEGIMLPLISLPRGALVCAGGLGGTRAGPPLPSRHRAMAPSSCCCWHCRGPTVFRSGTHTTSACEEHTSAWEGHPHQCL
ncbi:hypothetical protein Hamer_G010886 [Homarus americanus]|uniref:Uncharacterized protein n=1 Tax=Homarus americanus TaxID=6706 RepID=A0A8J5JQF6_HOMAM|nr:hypothetical protein Hamer_G010886 [Homarus americanus]